MKIYYKVLWVDDEIQVVENLQIKAEGYDLDVRPYTSWEEAYEELQSNFDDYSAIILDAYCKRTKEEEKNENFINSILPELRDLFGKNQKDIPWYIYSAGKPNNFDETLENAHYNRRDKEEWGRMLYRKGFPPDNPEGINKLFENIQRVAAQKGINVVLYRYEAMFKYLGEGKLYGAEARKLMLKMLYALHYPEENPNFQYVGNDIRKVVEHMFRAARKKGLLADECVKYKDNINLSDSSLYMAGKNTKYAGVRYGIAGTNKDGSGGDSIFPQDIAYMVSNIITVTSKDGTLGSHTKEETDEMPYTNDYKYRDLFFGYLLQLCHVLNWFAEYVNTHPDAEENKKMKRLLPVSDNTIDNRKANNVSQENESKYQETEIVLQDSKDMPQEVDTTPQKEKKLNLAKVSRDDVLEKEFVALNEIILCHTTSCKLSPDCKTQVKVGDKVRIVDVIDNTDADKDKFPFIATKIEKL